MTETIITVGRAVGIGLAAPFVLVTAAAVQFVRQLWTTTYAIWTESLSQKTPQQIDAEVERERRERESKAAQERRRARIRDDRRKRQTVGAIDESSDDGA